MSGWRLLIIVCAALFSDATCPVAANDYVGRVVDAQGLPVLYATVYPLNSPAEGTATNADGIFRLSTSATPEDTVCVSFVGFEKNFLPLSFFAASAPESPATVTLREQPIALEETVVEAKRTRKSKRKLLAQILHATYTKIDHDFPHNTLAYNIVSDVRLDAQSADTTSHKSTPWGMEQMIATVYEAPAASVEGSDSVQFVGTYCKRYCPPEVRSKIDGLYRQPLDPKTRKMATALDSGTLVHRALWKIRLDKNHLLDTSDELRRWKMSSEDNTRCVLTYTYKRNYLGIFKFVIKENLIVDAYDFTLQSYTVDVDISVFLPFSVKLKGVALDWLNLFNMDNRTLEKFRLKKGHVHARISTVYGQRQGVLVPVEKNMFTDGFVQDRRGNRIPVTLAATQQLTSLQTGSVSLLPAAAYRSRSLVPRHAVPIY